MPKKLRNFLIGFAVFLLILGIGGTLFYKNWVNSNTPLSFPQVEGEIQLKGLDAPVSVYRDEMGIPHIYASTLHDLYMAQGYVHAQDRFWQMDAWRHIGSGRLSEMFGEGQLKTDAFLRTLGWRQTAEEEYAAAEGDAKLMLDSYAEGVNAYLSERSGTELSLEYGVLKLLSPDYLPEPWTPIHTLTWGKAMAWDLRGNIGAEIERSILLKTLTPEQVETLSPPYPQDHPVIVPSIGENTALPATSLMTALSQENASQALARASRQFTLLDDMLGPTGAGIGSNSWVIAGSRTESGMPLLANDPHLGVQMPSIWHQINLHCYPRTEDCSIDVGGFSFPGVPGVVIGHNDKIAWGFTNVGPDVMDLYIEKINPENPNQYEFNGEWLDFEIRTEKIMIAGGGSEEITVRISRHGPIISDSYGPLKNEDINEEDTPYKDRSGIDLPENYAIALSWTALEPGNVFNAIWGFNNAQNWEEFRQAASGFAVPSQNLVYADVEGNIGYQMPGNVPIRKNGDGRYPVPGWTDEYDWQGYIPFEELPYLFNPKSGYIVTANNRVAPWDYEYFISADTAYGYRAQRIVDMIEAGPEKFSIAYIQEMQGDGMDLNAQTLIPLLDAAPLEDADLIEMRTWLSAWDRQNDINSAQAALFAAYWKHLLALTFNDDLPEEYRAAGGSRWFEVMRTISPDSNNFFWDDKNTPAIESRDEIFVKAFAAAVKEMEDLQGKNREKWAWGALHTVTFRNSTLGNSGISLIENLFNRGPYETAGGESIVNATGWTTTESYEVDWLPSMRMIVDMSNLDNSLSVHTTGESGHAGHPHYVDMADMWRNIEYYPMMWDMQRIMENAEGHLTLVP